MSSRSLLVIDDNDDFITLVKLSLELDTDWKIFTALDGREGIVKAQKLQPDLILLDVAMPHLDGIAVYKILKSNQATRSIPTIFLTAMIGIEKAVQLEVNADVEVITKPMSIVLLQEQIIDLYERYSFASQL
ncbi:response regulator [Pleurocapsa sp. PCC 7319]|uniref:response regulator n=1 Tax=Pleurocapsa sp. PCC 7319 TaxID=118161 RepID=UPI000364D6E4|nr:response regulator [Pleurocapsa sp. PCC 7319]